MIHRYDDIFIYGQSFWMTVCSTVISTATNIILITDYSRTKNFTKCGTSSESSFFGPCYRIIFIDFYPNNRQWFDTQATFSRHHDHCVTLLCYLRLTCTDFHAQNNFH